MTIRTLTLAVVLVTAVVAVADSTYKVRSHDTVAKVSQKFGLTAEELASANNLRVDSRLKVGTMLTIPDLSSTVSPTTSSSTTAIGEVEVTAINVIPHAGPHDGSKSLDPVVIGTVLSVVGKKPGWYQVQLPTVVGWIDANLVSFTPAVTTEPAFCLVPVKKEETHADQPVVNSALLKKALAMQGARYRWGGTSRSSGFDCSGLTSTVFGTQGIKLPRTAIEQSHVGNAVEKSNLKPGDLVFFRTSRSYRVNHVGIYIGEGKFIHAATGAGHVMVSDLGEKYYLRCYATARRVADVETASRAVEASRAAAEDTVLGPAAR